MITRAFILSWDTTYLLLISFQPYVMLKHFLEGALLSSSPCFLPYSHSPNAYNPVFKSEISTSFFSRAPKLEKGSISGSKCRARRRIIHEYEDAEEDEGYNEEIAALEAYSESARNEALIVKAIVDEEEVEVLIFKGFSSCLSSVTSPDPAKSILPSRAVIKFIDRVKGPIDPPNIQYIEKGLTWEIFKRRLSLSPN